MKMRPMSEAPKDGTEFLAVFSCIYVFDGRTARHIEICRWGVDSWINREHCEVDYFIGWYALPDYENDEPIVAETAEADAAKSGIHPLGQEFEAVWDDNSDQLYEL